jgi:hypothetical protein|tara:strand:- start:446 stop:895 length:450 start_codon:yes stop_codon:yes gene_type:complete
MNEFMRKIVRTTYFVSEEYEDHGGVGFKDEKDTFEESLIGAGMRIESSSNDYRRPRWWRRVSAENRTSCDIRDVTAHDKESSTYRRIIEISSSPFLPEISPEFSEAFELMGYEKSSRTPIGVNTKPEVTKEFEDIERRVFGKTLPEFFN